MVKNLVAKYEGHYRRYGPATFFVGGFLFDIFTLGRIDDWFNIAQQFVYICLLITIISLEARESERPHSWPKFVTRLWHYRDEASHFLFGSLLSCYTLFYFKSASLVTSFFFLLSLVTLMVANESGRFQRLGIVMRFAMLSLCVVSYAGYLMPISLGWVGAIPFTLSIAFTAITFYTLHRRLGHNLRALYIWRRLPKVDELDPHAAALTQQKIKEYSPRASFGVLAAFVLMYILQVIPPVPLSIQTIGIYHDIQKEGDRYMLYYDHPSWRFWESGAQTFLAQPGDRVYVFASVFSPARFKDQIFVRWLFKDPKSGWQSSDAIPINISGGRAKGYRGYAYKQNYTEGHWRVQLETSDGREIGRIGFDVVPTEASNERAFEVDVE